MKLKFSEFLDEAASKDLKLNEAINVKQIDVFLHNFFEIPFIDSHLPAFIVNYIIKTYQINQKNKKLPF